MQRYALYLVLTVLVSPTGLDAETVDFVGDVLPILESHCVGCHSADQSEGGLELDSHRSLLGGGDSGLAITPGITASSRLWLMVTGQLEPTMPPEGEQRLNQQQLDILAAWIEQGAMGPEGDVPIRRELRIPKIEPRSGIKSPATAIAISPDRKMHAVARYGRIDLIRDGKLQRAITGAMHKVNSLQFSADGTRLLAASGSTGAYGVAAIYSVITGELLKELVGHRDILYSAVWSPDETTVATAGYDREIILWNASTGQPIHNLLGHNGAIYDLDFSPDGRVLVSACADETAKVWNVATGQRLDTLSQPEGEVFAVRFTDDGKYILAISADNRLRVWSFESTETPKINPLVATRFVDESPLVNFELTPDGKSLVVLSAAGNLKLIRTSDWIQFDNLPPVEESASDLSIDADSQSVYLSLMNGEVARRSIPVSTTERTYASETVSPIYMDLGEPKQLLESGLPIDHGGNAMMLDRGVVVDGTISQAGESDRYTWSARAGEVWAIDADAVDSGPLDPVVSIFNDTGDPVLRTRLQAVRDSYFTFRGKDSSQASDFRLFNWQEMKLDEYLYASGEVTKLWIHPRGPDSGFNVYPAEGKRWTYFGTTHAAHALGEPAYIVRPLEPGEPAVANGLPVFDIYYENDDDPMRLAGTSSRLTFTAPVDGNYSVRITDTRGEGGDNYKYRLAIRAATPTFIPSLKQPNRRIRRGAGREFTVHVDRYDEFEGPVVFEIRGLPDGLISNAPITVQSGQRYAVGTLWAAEGTEDWEGEKSVEVLAHATINGRHVERSAGRIEGLVLETPPKAIASVHPIDHDVAENEAWTLRVRRGGTISARVKLRRAEGFSDEVRFGLETAGRNAAHGVYVDNIGLNGLLVKANEDQMEFFLTADPVAQPGKRSFFLEAQVDGSVTSHPIEVEVLP